MKRNFINNVIVGLVMIVPINSYGQDYHFSQFDAMAPTYQPGLTGMLNDYQYRGATQYRNQWRPLANKPFSTFAMSFDMPINERWGAGGYIVNYDGAKVFNAFNVVLSGAYQITDPGQKEHFLSTGIQMGIIYKNTNIADLLFESQYDEGQFNPALESNETFQRFSKLMPEFNMGAYYEWIDRNNQYHPYIGATIFHMTSPKESLLENSSQSKLPRRYLLNGGCKFEVNREMKLDLKTMYQYQGKARELMFGLGGSYLLVEHNTDLKLGCYYRWKDAVSVVTGVNYEDLTFAISYDIITSGLKEFNGGMGALEFVLAYTPGK